MRKINIAIVILFGAVFCFSNYRSLVMPHTGKPGWKCYKKQLEKGRKYWNNFRAKRKNKQFVIYDCAFGGDFRNYDFSNTVLKEILLVGSDFSNADLTDSSFIWSKLTNVNFTNANLTNVNFANTEPINSDFWFLHSNTKVIFKNVIFKNADMKGAKIQRKWYNYFKRQGVRNFDKIIWVD